MTTDANFKSDSFAEVSKIFPAIVYKYRVWEKAEHKTILTDRAVWFAAPSSFDDPLDCKNPIRYDLLDNKEISQVYLNRSKEDNPNYSRQQHRAFVREWVKRTPLKDKEHLSKIKDKDFNEFNNLLGILSLSLKPANMYMWEKYSQNHTGFVVGFNPIIAFKHFGGSRMVKYDDKLPVIKPRPFIDFMEQIELQVYYKLSKWKDEEEYRVQKFGFKSPNDENRKITLPLEAYSEIIFGGQINPDAKNEIKAIIKTTMPHIKLRQAQLNNKEEIIICDEL